MAQGHIAMCLALVALLAMPASASVSVSSEAAGANPIRRVVTLLQKMAEKVEAEGEREEELYKKFMCYCKNSGADLTKAIAESNAKVPQVQSDIEAGQAELQQLKLDLKAHQEDRDAAKAAMDAATAQRDTEHKAFLATSGEYKSYIGSLAGAIPAIESGMAGGFLQTHAGAQLKQAVLSDTSLSDYDRQVVVSFLVSGNGNEQGYVPKSGEIVGILKQLKDDFEKSLQEVTETENEAVKNYEGLMDAKTKQVAALTEAIEKKSSRSGELAVEIETMKGELSDEEAALIADQKFLANLDEDCNKKTSEWDERKQTRAEELVAIHETIKVLNDDDALELFKKTLPSPGSSLLQVGSDARMRSSKALKILRAAGRKPETGLVALALSGKQVDFTKVIKMIDDMVILLGTEQTDDDNKKEYCEKQIDETEDKAKEFEKNIEDLEASIADKEEAMTTLAGEIKDLKESISTLDKEVAEATENRKKERDEYTQVMTDDSAAKELLGYAKNRLHKFYNPKLYKAPPKRVLTEEERVYSNMGGEIGGTALIQLANKEAPAPPPATWDAYSKKGAETAGVISMIDLLIKDLDKEMTEATTEEENAQKEYEAVMADSAAKRAADTKLLTAQEKAKADTESAKVTAEEEKTSKTKELMAAKAYEASLHGECDWLLQYFDVRKEARASEVDALKSAKAVLSGADFSLVQRHGALRGAGQ